MEHYKSLHHYSKSHRKTTIYRSVQAETSLTHNKFVIVITMPIDNSTR
ncbi:Uncharacterised protein [Bacillus tequilensis]|nr:Uncharacterised protein [Bacillus tequilensis]